MNINTAMSYANDIGGMLGLNQWKLEPGMYNGEYFYVVESVLSKISSRFNPLDGMMKNASKALGYGGDKNDNLAYGSYVTVDQVQETGQAKIQIFTPPNSADVFEDMGWQGEEITFSAIIAGSDALIGSINFFSRVFTPSKVEPKELYRLSHPVFGEIKPARLIAYKRVHSSRLYQASLWQLTFRTSRPFFMEPEDEKEMKWWETLLEKAGMVFGMAQGIMGAYGAAKTGAKIISNAFSTVREENKETDFYYYSNELSLPQAMLIAANNSLFGAKCLIEFSGDKAKKALPELVSAKVDSSYLYPQMEYFKKLKAADINSLVSIVYASINDALDLLKNGNKNDTYKTISILNNLSCSFSDLATSTTGDYLGGTVEYKLPRTMSLLELCIERNLEYGVYSKMIIDFNRGIILSRNVIPEGLIIIVPVEL